MRHCASRISYRELNIIGPEQITVVVNVLGPIKTYQFKRNLGKFAQAERLARRQDEIPWLVMLQHQPHALNVFGSPSPVADDIQITKREPFWRPT